MDRKELSANMSLVLLALGGGGVISAIQITETSPYRLVTFATSVACIVVGVTGWLWLFLSARRDTKSSNVVKYKSPDLKDEWGRKYVPGRIFLKTYVDGAHLMEKVAGKTELQADHDAKWYVGKWITVTGSVIEVSKLGNLVTASLTVPKGPPLSSIYLVFSEEQDRLFALHKNETITVKGKVTKIRSDAVNLVDCFITG